MSQKETERGKILAPQNWTEHQWDIKFQMASYMYNWSLQEWGGIVKKNGPKFDKTNSKETKWITSTRKMRRITPKCITGKFTKTIDKEQLLKAAKEDILYREE